MSRPPSDQSLPLFLLALLVFHSPLTSWWTALELPWYAMFLPWLGIIVLIGLNQWQQGRSSR